jgi:hypothetical protein
MARLEDRTSRLEAATGTNVAGQKTRQVIIRGAHDKLWLYTIAAVGDEPAKVIREEVITEEDVIRLCGTEKQRALRTIRSNITHTACWRMEHWPGEYPTLVSALRYGADGDHRHLFREYDDELYDQAYAELIAEAT